MKALSMIFIVLGTLVELWFYPFLGIAGVLIGFLAILSMLFDEKSIPLGVLVIIFASLPGGIFYLCWDDEKE